MFVQGRVNRDRTWSPPRTNKKIKKMYEPTVFKTLNNETTKDSDCEMENKMRLCFPELTTLRRFPGCVREGRIQTV